MSKINPALYSSERQDWQTPPEVYEPILRFIGCERFDLDPFCSDFNIPAYYHACILVGSGDSIEFDGFNESWIVRPYNAQQPTVWVNPPYGRDLKRAMAKCAEEARKGCKIWALVPARTETTYQHDYGLAHADFVVFLRGRIKFINAASGESEGTAPFPTMLLYWGEDAAELAKRWVVEQPLKGTVMMGVKG